MQLHVAPPGRVVPSRCRVDSTGIRSSEPLRQFPQSFTQQYLPQQPSQSPVPLLSQKATGYSKDKLRKTAFRCRLSVTKQSWESGLTSDFFSG
uniref:Uncharacterized protein n=1 Tax=Ornithodoros erraticus TaxID=265619 RepID=A0A293MR02_ORNER